jgi:hypothetical protein
MMFAMLLVIACDDSSPTQEQKRFFENSLDMFKLQLEKAKKRDASLPFTLYNTQSMCWVARRDQAKLSAARALAKACDESLGMIEATARNIRPDVLEFRPPPAVANSPEN